MRPGNMVSINKTKQTKIKENGKHKEQKQKPMLHDPTYG